MTGVLLNLAGLVGSAALLAVCVVLLRRLYRIEYYRATRCQRCGEPLTRRNRDRYVPWHRACVRDAERGGRR